MGVVTSKLIGSRAGPSTAMNTQTVTLASFPSKSNPSISHTVSRGKDGVVYCSCPSWKFQHNSPANRTCKHIEQWKAETKVGGVSLLDVMGPGPEAVRPVRRTRTRKAAFAPVTRPSLDTQMDRVGEALDFEEPNWACDSKPARVA